MCDTDADQVTASIEDNHSTEQSSPLLSKSGGLFGKSAPLLNADSKEEPKLVNADGSKNTSCGDSVEIELAESGNNCDSNGSTLEDTGGAEALVEDAGGHGKQELDDEAVTPVDVSDVAETSATIDTSPEPHDSTEEPQNESVEDDQGAIEELCVKKIMSPDTTHEPEKQPDEGKRFSPGEDEDETASIEKTSLAAELEAASTDTVHGSETDRNEEGSETTNAEADVVAEEDKETDNEGEGLIQTDLQNVKADTNENVSSTQREEDSEEKRVEDEQTVAEQEALPSRTPTKVESADEPVRNLTEEAAVPDHEDAEKGVAVAEAEDGTQEERKTPRRGRRSAVTPAAVSATKTPNETSSRARPLRSAAKEKPVEPVKGDREEQEGMTPVRGRRSLRGQEASEPTELQSEEPEEAQKTPRRGRPKKVSENSTKKLEVDKKEGEEEEHEKKTPARRGRRSYAAPAPENDTRSDDDERGDDEAEATPARSLRTRHGAPTPKATHTAATGKTSDNASVKPRTPSSKKRGQIRNVLPESDDEEDVEVEKKDEVMTPRGRKAKGGVTQGKTPKTPKSEQKKGNADDPFDFDNTGDIHPEPLKNIHMEVHSFGEMRFSKVGAGKYSNTEKAAQERVGSAIDTTPVKAPQRKSLMELNRTEVELAAQGTKSAPAKRSKGKKLEDGETEARASSHTPKRPVNATATTPKTSATRKRRSSPNATSARKQQKVEVPELDDVAQVAADLPDDGPPGVLPGSRVYGLYDKVYYPAKVISRDGLGRFQVYFVADAIVKELPEASVIPLSELSPGRLAAVTLDDESVVPVRILTPPSAESAAQWARGVFELETAVDEDDGEHNVEQYSKPWDKLMLDMEEWKDYIRNKSAHATDVKTDNIESTEDRSKRRSRAAPTPAAATPKNLKTPRRKSNVVHEGKEEEVKADVEKSPKKKATEGEAAVTPGRKGRTPKRGGSPPPPKSAKKSRHHHSEEHTHKNEKKKYKPTDTSDAESEDTPKAKWKTLFDDKVFILTSANRMPAEGQLPFRKNEMKLRIIERGGVVVEDINQIPMDADAYLISDTYYRTHKFLAALARNMPCVSHEWIHQCVVEGKFLPYTDFLLQAGLSIVDNVVYNRKEIRGELLAGRRVCIHSLHEPAKKALSFCDIWRPIAIVLGAEIRTIEQAVAGDVDIVVTDATCEASAVEQVTAAGGVVVSSEWLIQAIVMGEQPPFDGHPRFVFDCMPVAQ